MLERTCLILSLSLAACSIPAVEDEPGETHTFVLDPSFTPEERLLIEAAGAQWHDLAPRVTFKFVTADQDHPLVPPCVYRGNPFGMVGSQRLGEVWLREDVGRDAQYRVGTVAHELGHFLGLGHVPHGVMQEYGSEVEFSAWDRAECSRAGVCR